MHDDVHDLGTEILNRAASAKEDTMQDHLPDNGARYAKVIVDLVGPGPHRFGATPLRDENAAGLPDAARRWAIEQGRALAAHARGDERLLGEIADELIRAARSEQRRDLAASVRRWGF